MVFIAEIGDKTHLLVLLLACRYRKPWVAGMLAPEILQWIVGWSFSERLLACCCCFYW
ncbi:TMEM165/GDT1 family protein [Parendozoicomonas sp. Alg238-R29]|uniref:TMEM165/GDT1 family protein n=1 Tax=Parendozoicomonas sp. Alg238-R29 TaxID=2993446 RepID=UPI00248E7A3C|nr:TMEM165/GDT1 family protein [Parendozoicomonas sp. Alg238-R29]